MRWALGVTAVWMAGASASPAYANDGPVYAAAPAWVKPAPAVDPAKLGDASPILLVADQQHRFENGGVTVYSEQAIRMASSQVLAQAGTVQLPWQPHNGELIVHGVDILRAGETIDVLKNGNRFSVLRREEQLEQLQLNGILTATMTVEGLRIGDVLRIRASFTSKDTALGGQVQTIAPLIGNPMRADFARTRLSWPSGAPVQWRALADGLTPRLTSVGGFDEVELIGTLDKMPDLPADAPVRYRPLPIVEATSFADWNAVSRTMAPHYATEDAIPAGGAVAAQVAKIRAASSDPRTRAAMALRVVQDEIRYLYNGMAGGNYIPQSPDRTWSLRYGDCKAKTLLLLAMLRALDIESEAVLVHSQMGDFAPKRLPSAAAFDHVIVRAVIDGQSLWLDGTQTGARLEDIADTPGFRHALPLRAAGAGLMPIEARVSARPDVATTLEVDQRAGVDFPAPYTISMRFRGQPGQQVQQIGQQGSREQIEQFTQSLIKTYVDTATVYGEKIDYDVATGIATLSAQGIIYPGWQRKGAEQRIAIEYVLPNIGFAPDRTRSAWRAIPVATGDPSHLTVTTRTQLPQAIRLSGQAEQKFSLAGHDVWRRAVMERGVLTLEERQLGSGVEIAPADIARNRDAVSRAKGQLLYAVSSDATPVWEQIEQGKKAKRFDAILDGYARDIAASPDQSRPLFNRAWFRNRLFDRAGAIADLTSALAIDDNIDYLLARAEQYGAMGEDRKALADLQRAVEIDPGSQRAIGALARVKAELGDGDGALELVDSRASVDSDEGRGYLAMKASVLARIGAAQNALDALDSAVAASPRDAGLLNNRCWLKATENVALDTALADCTRSIELAENPAAALDSRAFAYFRLDRLDEALADLNSALDLEPNMTAALYLRGIVHSHRGDAAAAGRDLQAARMMSLTIARARDYDRWGVKPKS